MTDQLTDQQFSEALGANPRGVKAPKSPERLAQWRAAQALETHIESALQGVAAPAGLQQQLLDIAAQPAEAHTWTAAPPAANEVRLWQRILPTAAVLVLALGMGWYFQIDQTLALQDDLFAHLYTEEAYYPQDRHYMLADVNAHLEESMGAHLNDNADTRNLDVTFVKDCRIAKQVGTHLVMQGSKGPVNIIVLPKSVVDTDTLINDERFSGLVTSASGHTVVIIGNKQEPIAEYRNLLDSSLDWEY